MRPHGSGRRAGASLTEYPLLIAAIAIGLLGLVTVFGYTIAGRYRRATVALGPEKRPGPPTTEIPEPPVAPTPPTAGQPGPPDHVGPPGPHEGPEPPGTRRPPRNDNVIKESGGDRWRLVIRDDGSGEVMYRDGQGRKLFKMTAQRVAPPDIGYGEAEFAGKGTLNFCNSRTYAATLAFAGRKGEYKGASLGGSQIHKTIDTDSREVEKGKPGLEAAFSRGWYFDLLAIEGG